MVPEKVCGVAVSGAMVKVIASPLRLSSRMPVWKLPTVLVGSSG